MVQAINKKEGKYFSLKENYQRFRYAIHQNWLFIEAEEKQNKLLVILLIYENFEEFGYDSTSSPIFLPVGSTVQTKNNVGNNGKFYKQGKPLLCLSYTNNIQW